jgi:hypothetical protein
MRFLRRATIIAAICLAPVGAEATQPKIDADTCTSLRLELIKFRQSGILDDMSKGAEWAKANLTADRLREIEHYMQLDEQVKFGCRDAKVSPEAERASAAAARIEINSDADPTAPLANDPPKPGAADKKDAPKKTSGNKAKSSDPKAQKHRAKKSSKASQVDGAPQPPVAVQSNPESAGSSVTSAPAETSSVSDPPTANDPSLPAFGFGETTVLPHSAP